MHPYDHGSVIYNSQDLERAQVPISRGVDRKTVVHLHNGILPSSENEGTFTLCNSTDRPGEYYAE